jgi:hypothetical protein
MPLLTELGTSGYLQAINIALLRSEGTPTCIAVVLNKRIKTAIN